MLDALDDVGWDSLASGTGRATRVPDLLRRLGQVDEVDSVAVLHSLFDDIWIDGEIFPATVPVVPFLVGHLASPTTWLTAKVALVLGVLAEGESAVAGVAAEVRDAVAAPIDVYLRVAAEPFRSPATELALLYLLAHFPEHRSRIEAEVDSGRWSRDDAARLQRCLTIPDFDDPTTLSRIGRAWPTPAIWQLSSGEEETHRRWKDSINLDTAEAANIWELETKSLLAYLGAQAEHAVKEASGVR
jgi:hypothetical protein